MPLPLRVLFKLGAYKESKFVDKAINSLNDKKSYDNCSVVAWDLLQENEVWFSGKDIKVGMKASSSLWLLVPPFKNNERIFVDGGVTENIPISKVNKDGFDGTYIIIDCYLRKVVSISKNEAPSNALDLMSMLHSDSYLQLANREAENMKKQYNVLHVLPHTDIFTHALEIDKEKMDKFFEMGENAFNNFSSNK